MDPAPLSLKDLVREGSTVLPSLFTCWQPPRVFLQCGSGFQAEQLFDAPPQMADMSALPGMPAIHTPDREHPALLYGYMGGVPVLATRGHRHLYEGAGIIPCVLPLCTARSLGADTVILVEGGLSLSQDIKPGTWLLLTDFINGHHCSPLDGNHDMLENPFPDMNSALSQHLNSELVNALAEIGITPKLGIFYSRPGSQFCTVSEATAAKNNGADLIGHDLAMEIIMGQALGCNISAFALAALSAPNFYSKPLQRKDFLDACTFCSYNIMRGIRKGLLEYLDVK